MSVKLLSSRLKQTFGYDEFRPLQREIMEASLAGRDALAILPTGAGKSHRPHGAGHPRLL